MSYWYQVILRPCDVKFTCKQISTKFKNGRLLQALLDDLLEGKQLVKDLPVLEVIWYVEKWEWYTLDNRLLWVFQELEKAGQISYIEMRRVEFVCKAPPDHPSDLYNSVSTVEMEFEEPVLDRKPAVKAGKKSRDVKLLSKSLGRLKLCKRKAEKSHIRKKNNSRSFSSSSVDICDSNTDVLDVACTEETQHIDMQPVEIQPKQIQPTEMQSKPLEPAEMQVKEVQPAEMLSKQIQTVDVLPLQVKPTEIQSKEIEHVEAQPKQIQRQKETEHVDTQPRQIQHVQMPSKETQAVEMQPKEKESLEMQPVQIKPTEIQSKEMEHVETQPNQIQSTQMHSKEMQPVEMQQKEAQPVMMQPEEMESVEMRAKEVQPVETEPRQIQPREVQHREVHPIKMQPEEMESVEMQAKEVQPMETEPRQIQPTEVQPREVQPVETRPKKMESVETQPKQIHSVEMQSKEMVSLEMQPMEMKPVEMKPKQFQRVEMQPMQMQQKMDEAVHVHKMLDLNDNIVLDIPKTFAKASMPIPCKKFAIAENESADAILFKEEQCAPLQLEEGTSLFNQKDEKIGPVSDLSNFPPGSCDVFLKEESGGNAYDNGMDDDVLSICHSHSPSICSSSPDSHDVDDWGCENQEPSGNCGNVDQSSDDEWIEIESIQDLAGDSSSVKNTANDDAADGDAIGDSYDRTSNKAKETVQAWLNDRKKFCRNSNNFLFHEYVVDNINPKKSKKSLSQSLLSLDSAFSSTSALSSISREQRQISVMSGLFGYGNFDKYNAEYLSKLRADRMASRRRLKPYDVASRRHGSTRPRATSPNWYQNKRDDFAQRRYSKTFICTEERVRKQTYSETVSFDERKSHKYRHVTSTVCKSSSWYYHGAKMRDRGRSYSETDFRPQRSRRRSMSSSNSKRHRLSSLSSTGSSSGRCTAPSLCEAFKDRTLSKESLYSFWQNRREEYMKARYMGSSSRHKSQNSLALTGYTCGICFKSFETRTRREQHSDELMHWACITCGRFFASHTALGQHVEEVGHRKD